MRTDPSGSQLRGLAGRTLVLLSLLAVPLVVVATWQLGWHAGASALTGVGFVLVLFGASALSLAWVSDRRPGTALAVLLGGALGRLALYAATLGALGTLTWVHRPTLAVATGVAVAVTLAAELRWLSRTPSLFWVDAEACRPTAVSHATRS